MIKVKVQGIQKCKGSHFYKQKILNDICSCTTHLPLSYIGPLTAENKDCIVPNALFVCLLFVCLLVYLFICLFVDIKVANSCPEWTKVRGKTEKTVHRGSGMSFGRRPKFIQSVENGLNFAKIKFSIFSVNLSSLSPKLAEI